jgi:glycosyltransferase involved in cell wall biosynthesis
MRIAFVSVMAGSPWAASEALWAETAHLALREGHELLVSTLDWPKRPAVLDELEREGAQLALRPQNRWHRRSALITRLNGSFSALKRFGPDVICVNQGGTYDIARSGSNAVLRSILNTLGTPYVVLCHCEQPPPPRRNLLEARAFFARAFVVGMVGAKLRALSEAHLGASIPNVRVFHNPVNLRTIERLNWPESGSPVRFAFVGRLDSVKNVGALLDAFSQANWRTRDWFLTIFGSGPERPMLELQVQRAGLGDHVRFGGFATDIAAVWADHHALILPSRFEGVPLAMIEAMLCGRPVVATDIGAISEWIDEGRNGFLIATPTPRDIADALERLWTRRAELESLGRYAHERTVAKRDKNPARTLLDWIEAAGARSHATATLGSHAPRLERPPRATNA